MIYIFHDFDNNRIHLTYIKLWFPIMDRLHFVLCNTLEKYPILKKFGRWDSSLEAREEFLSHEKFSCRKIVYSSHILDTPESRPIIAKIAPKSCLSHVRVMPKPLHFLKFHKGVTLQWLKRDSVVTCLRPRMLAFCFQSPYELRQAPLICFPYDHVV